MQDNTAMFKGAQSFTARMESSSSLCGYSNSLTTMFLNAQIARQYKYNGLRVFQPTIYKSSENLEKSLKVRGKRQKPMVLILLHWLGNMKPQSVNTGCHCSIACKDRVRWIRLDVKCLVCELHSVTLMLRHGWQNLRAVVPDLWHHVPMFLNYGGFWNSKTQWAYRESWSSAKSYQKLITKSRKYHLWNRSTQRHLFSMFMR